MILEKEQSMHRCWEGETETARQRQRDEKKETQKERVHTKETPRLVIFEELKEAIVGEALWVTGLGTEWSW